MLQIANWTASVNQFTWQIIQKLLAENCILSPFSLYFSLLPFLHLGKTEDQDRQYAEAKAFAFSNVSDDAHSFAFARALFAHKDIALSQWMLKSARQFEMDIEFVDFQAADTAEKLNNWVSSHTQGLIPSLVGTFPPLTTLAIVNALYYGGSFMEPFDPTLSYADTFHGVSGDHEVMFMRRLEALYAEVDNLQAAMLPLSGTGALCIFLSRETAQIGFPRSPDEFSGIGWKRCEGELILPRFTLSQEQDCSPLLNDFGIQDALCNAGQRPFETDAPAWVGAILHKALIHVNEQGVTAAAASAACISGSMPEDHALPFHMVCNRPFSFMLLDRDERYLPCVLFAGLVADISQENML